MRRKKAASHSEAAWLSSMVIECGMQDYRDEL